MNNISTMETASAHQTLVLALHVLSMALGLGGATLADFFFFRFLRDFRISDHEASILRAIASVVLVAIGVAIVSGAILVAFDPHKYLTSNPFITKAVIVLVLTLNGVGLHVFIAPAMVRLSFLDAAKRQNSRAVRLRRVAFAMGGVSVVSWYSAFFLAMLKRLVPTSVTLTELLLCYTALLCLAVLVSQIMERRLRAQSRMFGR